MPESGCSSPLIIRNKVDLPAVQELIPKLEKAFSEKDITVLLISAVTGEGVEALKYKVLELLQNHPRKEEKIDPVKVFKIGDLKYVRVAKEKGKT